MIANEFARRHHRRTHVDRRRLATLSEFVLVLLLIAAGASEALAQGCVAPPEGMISWWPGDGNAADIVNGNDGILEGGADFQIGLVDQAFHLDGIDSFVNVPNSANLNFGTNDFTVDFWVKFDDVSSEQVLVEKWIQKMGDPPLGTGWTLKIDGSTGALDFFQGDLLSETGVSMFPPGIPANTWIHVAVSRAGHDIRLFWNGTFLGEFSAGLTNLNTQASLKLGHRCNSVDTPGCEDDRGFYLNGLIDEVEVFSRALRPTEIEAIYNAGSCGKVKPPSQLRVAMDIRPFVAVNRIVPHSNGLIPVAILGSETFDALQADPTTLMFGPGDAAAVSRKVKVKDVNRDGNPDLIVAFRARETDIECHDTEVTLIGETFAGESFTGVDSVVTVGCRKGVTPP